MSNNAANSRYEDRAVFKERKGRTPAYGLRIAEVRAELLTEIQQSHDATTDSLFRRQHDWSDTEGRVSAATHALRQDMLKLEGKLAGLRGCTIAGAAILFIYLWVTR